MKKITLIEDEPIIRSSLERLLKKNGYEVQAYGSVAEVEQGNGLNVDLIITDVRLPGEEGPVLLQRTRTPILVMTSYASLSSAVEIMRQGATDYIPKPFDNQIMLATVARALEKAEKEKQERENQSSGSSSVAKSLSNKEAGTSKIDIIGECDAMKKVFSLMSKVAPTDTTVLILGESGTGKELVARTIHDTSLRHDQAWVPVNCATFPESLIEAELFGYEKGAFTGADKLHKGLVEAADGGTLFLDEIGELPLDVQARLLRLLQEKEIRRVGGTESRKVDVRLVAATHQNLKQRVADGEFREDLYYRLNVFDIQLPPLRERDGDLLLISEFLLERYAGNLGHVGIIFEESAKEAILSHSWPGNVRELENAIEKAAILSDMDNIRAEHLGIKQAMTLNSSNSKEPSSGQDIYDDIPEGRTAKDHFFIEFVKRHEVEMSETELAKKLGVSRKTLWERRNKLGLPRKR